LNKEGFRVETAQGGTEGLELARKTKPEIITLDVMMPGMDGWEVLSKLKADPELRDIPVLLMTIVDNKNMGFALGASEYLTKPIDWDRLASLVRRYRKSSGQQLVLVVEDNGPTREMLQRNLEAEGCEVALAENGRIGLARFGERAPSLVLLDLMMPEMNGFEFLDELRNRPHGRQVPVIVLTAKDLTDEDRRRLEGQVTRVVSKGALAWEQLLEHIKLAIGSRSKPAAV
jgi:CheY-like chemotaxis protein